MGQQQSSAAVQKHQRQCQHLHQHEHKHHQQDQHHHDDDDKYSVASTILNSDDEQEFYLKKRCELKNKHGLYWQEDPTGKTWLHSTRNWPRDYATIRGRVVEVEGKKWLLATQVKQVDSSEWKKAPKGAALPFFHGNSYMLVPHKTYQPSHCLAHHLEHHHNSHYCHGHHHNHAHHNHTHKETTVAFDNKRLEPRRHHRHHHSHTHEQDDSTQATESTTGSSRR